MAHAVQYTLVWKRAMAPMVPNLIVLQDMFPNSPTVDAVYTYYCDANAAPALHDAPAAVRNLQIQSRVFSIAGLMARRYDHEAHNPVSYFAKNMQMTAQHNMSPMDTDHAIRMMSQMDLRRGIGTYTDYIHVPNRTLRRDPPRDYSDFAPAYDDTWRAFLQAVERNELHLPAVPIT